MTKITKEEVKKVAHLARLELNENEINNHARQLEKILDYIRQLEKIDTDDVPCTTRAIEVVNVFRKDEKKNSDTGLGPWTGSWACAWTGFGIQSCTGSWTFVGRVF